MKSPSALQVESAGWSAVQLLEPSLQASVHSGPVHGLPVPLHTPLPLQVSVWVQNWLSVHGVPARSLAVQVSVASSHVSLQSESGVTSAGQGLPVWVVQDPLALQVSVPLQNKLSVHVVPDAKTPQLPVPLHEPVRHACVGHSLFGSRFNWTGAQVPVAAPVSPIAHDMQVPLQAELQQMPPMPVWAQAPFAHCPLFAHDKPFGSFGTHEPPSQ